MTDTRRETTLKRLANEGLKTMDFFRSLPPEDLERQIYTAGTGWRANQILCHLLSAEQAFHHLISDILLGGPGAPEDMDIDAFNEENMRAMQCDDVEAVLKAFAQARITTIDIVRKMRPADFDRQGRHPFLGIASLEAMLKLIYRHAMIHQRDIRRVLDQGAPIGPPPDPQA